MNFFSKPVYTKCSIRGLFCFFLFLFFLPANCFSADKEFNLFGSKSVFSVDFNDFYTAGAGLALNGAALILDKSLSQNTPGSFSIDDINAFDGLLACSYSDSLDTFSTICSVAGLVTPAVLATTSCDEWFTIAVMYGEAFLYANGLKELSKALIFRPRPYMYFDGFPQDKVDDGDWDDSFFSGHTTFAFLGASFSSYVFSKYFPDSPWRFVVTAGTFSLAAATGFLRIKSGSHFTSDVITGAVIGGLCGFFIPWLHTLEIGSNTKNDSKISNSSLKLQVLPTGVGFSVKL